MIETTELNNYREQDDLKCCFTCRYSEFDDDFDERELYCFFDKETNDGKKYVGFDKAINVLVIGVCDNHARY